MSGWLGCLGLHSAKKCLKTCFAKALPWTLFLGLGLQRLALDFIPATEAVRNMLQGLSLAYGSGAEACQCSLIHKDCKIHA